MDYILHSCHFCFSQVHFCFLSFLFHSHSVAIPSAVHCANIIIIHGCLFICCMHLFFFFDSFFRCICSTRIVDVFPVIVIDYLDKFKINSCKYLKLLEHTPKLAKLYFHIVVCAKSRHQEKNSNNNNKNATILRFIVDASVCMYSVLLQPFMPYGRMVLISFRFSACIKTVQC